MDWRDKRPGQESAELLMAMIGARLARGKPAFTPVRPLLGSAWQHADDMANAGYFGHYSRDGSTWMDRAARHGYPHPVQENIAAGFDDAAGVVAGWMQSPGHRAALLGDYPVVGCAVVRDRDGRLYAVADFGTVP